MTDSDRPTEEWSFGFYGFALYSDGDLVSAYEGIGDMLPPAELRKLALAATKVADLLEAKAMRK